MERSEKPDRRRWFRIDWRQATALLAVLGGIGTVFVWSLKAAGVAPMMFPGERLNAIEENAAAVSGRLIGLEPLPARVDTLSDSVAALSRRVDVLATSAELANLERVDMLYLLCELARERSQDVILPPSCIRVRARMMMNR